MYISAYNSLGILKDVSDTLVLDAYRRQIATDPDEAPYYLRCLWDISKWRDSEALQTEYAQEESTGKYTDHMLHEAYHYFGFIPLEPPDDDDLIIGTYRARVSDAPGQRDSMRQLLQRIGHARKSEKICQVAEEGKRVFNHQSIYGIY